MIKLKEGKFYVTVNPFINKITITVYSDSLTHEIDYFYTESDEWTSIEVGDKEFDVHILYDECFWVYISKVEEGSSEGCGEPQDVQVEAMLYDSGPTIKLKKPVYIY